MYNESERYTVNNRSKKKPDKFTVYYPENIYGFDYFGYATIAELRAVENISRSVYIEKKYRKG